MRDLDDFLLLGDDYVERVVAGELLPVDVDLIQDIQIFLLLVQKTALNGLGGGQAQSVCIGGLFFDVERPLSLELI